MSHTIVVTGASSGIGKAIADQLIASGYEVLGISRTITAREGLIPFVCDLSDEKALQATVKQIHETYTIEGLVNAAGIGVFEPHEELNPAIITKLSFLNLTVPMLLSHAFLRPIKARQGFILNITSIEATRASKFSAIYSASKAGLRSFGLALFEEVRKSGVQVITINPDMTDTPFFDTLRFEPHPEAALDPTHIAQLIQSILALPKEATVTELTVRPQFFKIVKK